MDEKEFQALKSLFFKTNIIPRNLNMSDSEFKKMVLKLGEEGLLRYEIIEDHPVFKGDFGKIKITEKGKQVYEEEQNKRSN